MNQPVTTETIQAVVVSRAEMMRYHDPERIQAYCQSCEKYGMYWSCPPFEAQPFDRLADWSHGVVVTQKTPVVAASTPADLVDQFLVARQSLGERMLQCEGEGALAVIAGHCFGCGACTRPRGIACCVPARMRYSLEALGFDVTGLAQGLVGQTIPWPESGLPDHLLIVGALLCRDFDLATRRAGAVRLSAKLAAPEELARRIS